MSTHGHLSQVDTRSTLVGDERANGSWISVFSLVSRPAWSLLQRYFPGRTQTAFEMKSSLDMGNSLAPLKVAYFQCQHENAPGASSGDPGTLSWFTHDSLRELGIQNTSQKDINLQNQASVGYIRTARNLITQVLQNTQEKRCAKPENGCDLSTNTLSVRTPNSWRWGEFLEADDRPPNWLLNVAQSRKETDTSWQHCGEHHSVGYCQSDDGRSVHNESAGPLCSKEVTHNAILPKAESLPNSYQLPLDVEQQLQVCSRPYNEVAILTPDQDNGYYSLEEEHLNAKLQMRLLYQEQEASETASPVASEGGSSQTNTTGSEFNSEPVTSEVEIKESEEDKAEAVPAAENVPFLAAPQCQNKVIAYIMGSPCSGESESEDDGDWDSNDDDGFDSEGSSHFSDSEDLDDSDDESEEDSDGEEADSETERLWNSLCQNGDPYNPRNFSAPIRTASKPSPATTDSSVSESPPAHMSSQLSPPPLSPSLSENEFSEDACEIDEEENRRLWNSFSCLSDPYSLLNFQAPVQTLKTTKGCRMEKVPGTPRYKREEAEERLDSGFSEISPVPCSSSATAVQPKKVCITWSLINALTHSSQKLLMRLSFWRFCLFTRCDILVR